MDPLSPRKRLGYRRLDLRSELHVDCCWREPINVPRGVMYLFNSKFVHSICVFMCMFCFLCITSLMLDTRLVLAYMLSLMSGHNKFIT